MRTILAVGLMLGVLGGSSVVGQERPVWSWEREYSATERGPHHTRWSKFSVATNELGVAVLQTNSFTQVGSGLNRWTGTEWVSAAPELVATNGGFLGFGAQQTAFFASERGSNQNCSSLH